MTILILLYLKTKHIGGKELVEIKHISKKFKEFEALKDVSFTIHNGEIIGLLGENGAGKSTLLRIISTMLTPTRGNVWIDDIDIKNNPTAIRAAIGILFGTEVGLYEQFTARENLYYFAQLNGLTKKQANERIEQLANEFEFKDYINKPVGNLSKGMKQKIAIARSIIHDPSVILFDEPDSGLDFNSAKIVFDFIKFCKERKKAIIFSSHSMENIKHFSDRIVVLHKGCVIKCFSIDAYTAIYTDKQINEMLFDLVCNRKDNR